MDVSRPTDGAGEDRDGAIQGDSGPPSRLEIEATLSRILSSRPFASAPRQQALLRHIVIETLEARGERLKEFSIAVDVFGRSSTFDPRTDSIVRVQASRLRAQLAEYFAEGGSTETVRIEVPAGGYQASFVRVEPVVSETAAAKLPPAKAGEPPPVMGTGKGFGESWRKLLAAGWILPAALGTAAFALAVLAVVVFNNSWRRDPAVVLPSGPTVFVSQYELIDGPEFARILRNGLQYELINSLSRFPELSVLGIDTVYGDPGGGTRNLYGADFILQGSVQATTNELRVTSQLLETANKTVVWSRTDSATVSDASGILDVQARIAGDVAGQLSQPYGVIQDRLRQDMTASRALSMEDYVCVLEAYDYSRAKTAQKHAEVRDCLEQVTQHSPNYSPAWAKLSWMYGDEARYGFNRRPDTEPPFSRAEDAAMRAVAADSSSAMAHQYLAIAQFNLREDDAFERSIEMALRLNPNNSEILADAAHMLMLRDGSERALDLAEKAIAMNPGHPPWYYGPLANYYLLKGDGPKALEAARKGAPDGSPMAGFTLAAALRLNGDDVLANQALESIYATFPDARTRAQEIVESQRLPPKIVALIFGN